MAEITLTVPNIASNITEHKLKLAQQRAGQIDEICKFHQTHGRIPLKSSTDPIEKKLGARLITLRSAKADTQKNLIFLPLYQEIAESYNLPRLFERGAYGTSEVRRETIERVKATKKTQIETNSIQRKKDYLTEICEFVSKHNRNPYADKNNKVENRLAWHLHQFKQMHKQNNIPAELTEILINFGLSTLLEPKRKPNKSKKAPL